MQKKNELELPKESRKIDCESAQEIYGGGKRLTETIQDWIRKYYPSK